MAMVKPKVLVIGAGIAGLAAATKLVKSGHFDVELFEGSDRLGGRVNSEKFDGYNIEMGAQWVHGEVGNSIFQLLSPFHVLDPENDSEKQFGQKSYYITEKGQFLKENTHKKVFEFIDQLHFDSKPKNPIEPFGNFITQKFWEAYHNHELSFGLSDEDDADEEIHNSILDWIHKYQMNIDGSDSWNEASTQGQWEYKHCEGNPIVPWKESFCYNTLCNVILFDSIETHPLPNWIKFNKIVSNINYSNEPIEVTCTDGTVSNVDHLICTVSLGVLKANHQTLFQPILPEDKINAIEGLGIGTVDKVYIQFTTPWWQAGENLSLNLLWKNPKTFWEKETDDELLEEIDGIPLWCRGILCFYTIPNPKFTLQAWLNGRAARVMENLNEQIVQDSLMKVLIKFVGSKYNIHEPPIRIVRSTWNNNPLTRGSYSFRSVQSDSRNAWASQLVEPINLGADDSKPILCFAGEGTHSHYYSTVHGAYDTGIREANRLIDYFVQINSEK